MMQMHVFSNLDHLDFFFFKADSFVNCVDLYDTYWMSIQYVASTFPCSGPINGPVSKMSKFSCSGTVHASRRTE